MKIDKTQYRTIKELDRLANVKVGNYNPVEIYNPYGGKIFRKGHIFYIFPSYFVVAVEWPSLDSSDWQIVTQYYETNKEYEVVFSDDDSDIDYPFERYMNLSKEYNEDIYYKPDYMKKLLNLFSINKLDPKIIIGNCRLGLEAFSDDVSIKAVLAGMRKL